MYRYRDPPEFGCALHSNGSAHYRVICVLSVVDQKVKRSRDKGPEKACSRSMQTWTHVHTHIHTPHTVYIPYHMPHTPHSTTYHHPRTWHSSPTPLLTLTPHSHHTHNSPTHPAPRNTCSSIQSLPAHLPQQQRERWPGCTVRLQQTSSVGGFSYTLQPMCGKMGKNICTWNINYRAIMAGSCMYVPHFIHDQTTTTQPLVTVACAKLRMKQTWVATGREGQLQTLAITSTDRRRGVTPPPPPPHPWHIRTVCTVLWRWDLHCLYVHMYIHVYRD